MTAKTKRKWVAFAMVALPMLAMAAQAAPPKLEARGDNGVVVTIVDESCTSKKVLDRIKPEFRGRFQNGYVTAPKVGKLPFCWTVSDTPGMLFIVDEDGGMVEVSVLMFAPKPSI